MNTLHKRSIIVLVPFSLLTAYALWQVGISGLIVHLIDGPAAWQISADLVIALFLALALVAKDARAKGRFFWPWVVLTLAAGSFGPLLYFALSASNQRNLESSSLQTD